MSGLKHSWLGSVSPSVTHGSAVILSALCTHSSSSHSLISMNLETLLSAGLLQLCQVKGALEAEVLLSLGLTEFFITANFREVL